MSNVLNEEKQQQVIALGRLQWSLRRIEEHTGVRRETISAYLKAAGIAAVLVARADEESQPQPMSQRPIRLRQNRPMR